MTLHHVQIQGKPSDYDPSLYLVRISAPVAVDLITSGKTIAQEKRGNTQIISVVACPSRDFYIVASEGLIRKSTKTHCIRSRENDAESADRHKSRKAR